MDDFGDFDLKNEDISVININKEMMRILNKCDYDFRFEYVCIYLRKNYVEFFVMGEKEITTKNYTEKEIMDMSLAIYDQVIWQQKNYPYKD
jgi:hypothetical protein